MFTAPVGPRVLDQILFQMWHINAHLFSKPPQPPRLMFKFFQLHDSTEEIPPSQQGELYITLLHFLWLNFKVPFHSKSLFYSYVNLGVLASLCRMMFDARSLFTHLSELVLNLSLTEKSVFSEVGEILSPAVWNENIWIFILFMFQRGGTSGY